MKTWARRTLAVLQIIAAYVTVFGLIWLWNFHQGSV